MPALPLSRCLWDACPLCLPAAIGFPPLSCLGPVSPLSCLPRLLGLGGGYLCHGTCLLPHLPATPAYLPTSPACHCLPPRLQFCRFCRLGLISWDSTPHCLQLLPCTATISCHLTTTRRALYTEGPATTWGQGLPAGLSCLPAQCTTSCSAWDCLGLLGLWVLITWIDHLPLPPLPACTWFCLPPAQELPSPFSHYQAASPLGSLPLLFSHSFSLTTCYCLHLPGLYRTSGPLTYSWDWKCLYGPALSTSYRFWTYPTGYCYLHYLLCTTIGDTYIAPRTGWEIFYRTSYLFPAPLLPPSHLPSTTASLLESSLEGL